MNKENFNLAKNKIVLPKVVSQDKWLLARKKFFIKKKEATRAWDALNAKRRRLRMVEIDKNYVFEGPESKFGLLDLFDELRQLIVYHFMMEPWKF